jgi:predicted SAM-dependent methyltransferase
MPSRLLVNLGCGSVWHGAWQNFDLDPQHPSIRSMDLGRPLPFADGSVDAIYHAHVLEHFEPAAGQRLLAECHRVLKPGGIVRVVVPDLEELAQRYLAALGRKDELEYDWAVIELLDQMVRTKNEGAMGAFLREKNWRDRPWITARVGTEVGAAQPAATPQRRHRRPLRALARLRFALARLWLTQREAAVLREARFRATGENHCWMYDRFSLARCLQTAGFTKPAPRSATESAIADYASYQLDHTATGRARHPDSLYMEATKP